MVQIVLPAIGFPFFHAPRQVFFHETVQNRIHISIHKIIELVNAHIDAVIRDPPLGIIVGADPFAPVPGAYLALPVCRFLAQGFPHGLIVEPGFQDLQGLFLILPLAPFILAGHHHARGQVRNTNGRGRFVVMDIEDYERDRAEKKLLLKLQEAEEAVKTAKREAEEAVRMAQREAERAVQKAQEEAGQSVKAAKEEADKIVQSVKADAEETVKQVKQEAEKEVETAKKKQLQAEKEKEKAVAKSEANSLSRYILNALQERKERKNSKEDDNNQ